MRIQLAGAYLDKGDLDNFGRYEKLVKNKSNLTLTYNDAAYEMAKKGENLAEAEKLAKESLKLINEQIKHPIAQAYRSPKQQKKDIEYTYDLIADTYAFVLYKENKFGEALNYEQPVYDHLTRIDADIYENYIQILNALGKYREAQPIAEKAIVAGKSSDAINTQLKDIYTKLKGSDAGYNDYLTALKNQSANNTKEELAKTMINQPAPAFTLKDVDGNTVSLADLKGKIVIVDFWATWCGPCKASFPGMQLAVNKYKDNPDIKFLFVDCWETDDNFLPGVKKFISDNKYTFHVLLDEKGSDGKQAKVLNAYEVQGIPTKFIIDKTGNIRFKYVGYSGTPEKLVDEVTTMIDIATNPGSITSAPAAAGTKTGTGK
jgi:peroxiredoxin